MMWSAEQRHGESWHNVDENYTPSTFVIRFPVGVGTMCPWRPILFSFFILSLVSPHCNNGMIIAYQ